MFSCANDTMNAGVWGQTPSSFTIGLLRGDEDYFYWIPALRPE